VTVGGKLDRYEMARYLLGGPGKGVSTVTLQKLSVCFIGAANFERAPREAHDAEIVKPLAHIDGVERPCTVEYLSEDIFDFTAGQAALLYENNAHNKQRLTAKSNVPVIATADN
jgi:hypothetical protein